MQKENRLFRFQFFFFVTLFAALVFGAPWVRAQWVAPTESPPSGNVPAPINVGSTAQTKTGSLTIGGDVTIGGSVKGTGDRIPISGVDTAYSVEVGKLFDYYGDAVAGVSVSNSTFTFQSADGEFVWADFDADQTKRTILSLNTWANHPNALMLHNAEGIRKLGSDRVRVVPYSNPDAWVELGYAGNSINRHPAVVGGTNGMIFQSYEGAFEWWRDALYSSTGTLIQNSEKRLQLHSNGRLYVYGKLCLKVSGSYDCKDTWPSPSSSSSSITEQDTLASVTNSSRGSGYNQTAQNVPITIRGTLTVNQSITAQEYRLTNNAHVVTSDDYGHGKTGLQSIDADKLDGKHATEIIQEAAASLALGRGLTCTSATQTASGNVSAQCGSGKILVGGGCNFSGSNTSLLASYPDGSSWKCQVSNTTNVTATAVCCSL